MRFSFEESELLNNFFDKPTEISSKSEVITKLEDAKSNTNEKELVDIVNSTVKKIEGLDINSFNRVFNDFPLNDFTEY